MSNSKQEEVISALWVIGAILAFGFGFTAWGYLFTVKAVFDTACSLYYAIKETKSEAPK